MLVQFFDYFRKTYKAGSRRHQPAVRSSRMPQRQERFSGARTRGPDFTGFNRNATDRSGMCSVLWLQREQSAMSCRRRALLLSCLLIIILEVRIDKS